MRSILQHLFLAAAQARVVDHLVGQGVGEAEAHLQAAHAAAGGVGPFIQFILQVVPEIYPVIQIIAALFGVILPPLPPLPIAAPTATP